MDYTKAAAGILDAAGGPSNVEHLHHCATRLRFTLVNSGEADVARLKAVPGVVTVVEVGSQLQVVIGSSVNEVFDAINKLPGMNGATRVATESTGAKPKVGLFARLLDFLVGVFQPLIPAMAGAGILKSLLILLSVLGWVSKQSPTYTTLVSISDAVFYFLPLMVAVTTATKLGSNRLVALAAVSVLLLPSLTKAMAEGGGTSVFGFGIPNIAYSAQVFPAILCTLVLWGMERFWTKVGPKTIRVFFVPMMSLLFTVPLTLLVVGPLGFWAGVAFTDGILFLHDTVGWLALPVLVLALPFMISIGMHKALVPYGVQSLATTGREAILLPSLLAYNMGQAGTCFGVAMRTRDAEMRATAVSTGITALFGISEPALYGITLQNKRALYSLWIGSFAAAIWLGVSSVSGSVLVTPGVASLSMFVDPANASLIFRALIGVVIALVGSFVASMFLWSDAKSATLQAKVQQPDTPVPTTAPAPAASGIAVIEVHSPVAGDIVALPDVSDPVFAGGALGDGCAIRPTSNEFRSPVAGEVKMLFNTSHAVAVVTDEGVEVLIHVGFDTVRLAGRHFTAHIAKGDRVAAGELLITADLEQIAAAGYDITTPVVVTNSSKYQISHPHGGTRVIAGDPLFAVVDATSEEQVHVTVS